MEMVQGFRLKFEERRHPTEQPVCRLTATNDCGRVVEVDGEGATESDRRAAALVALRDVLARDGDQPALQPWGAMGSGRMC